MQPDPLVLVVGTLVSAFLAAIVLLFQARGFPPDIRGLREWGMGCALIFVAALFNGLRGMLPDFVAIVLGSLAIEAGIAMVYIGLLRFNDRAIPTRLLVAVMLLNLLSLVYFTHFEYSFRARVIIVPGTTALLFGLCLIAVLKGRPGHKLRFGDGFATLFFFAETLISLARVALAIWVEPPPADLLTATLSQQLYQADLSGYSLGTLLMAVGLILMANDRLKEALQYLAGHDTLTGAFARRAFIDLAEREQARGRRSGQPMVLLMVDLDHFKTVNDSHGHQVGDLVLQRFAGIAQACLRRQDIFGRYGGEEFMVMLPDTSRDTALMVAERICATVAKTPVIIEGQDSSIRITVSIGVAVGDYKTGLDRLIGLADEAMYRAKAAGRNRVEYAADAPVNDQAGIPAATG
ncbi:MAG: GGDEF domain-containing protein [Proteobacteria bacterium]|nr:GGDEF domain-containing protein [Pseudomonadota bacterium]